MTVVQRRDKMCLPPVKGAGCCVIGRSGVSPLRPVPGGGS